MSVTHAQEVSTGQRFQFGANWKEYSEIIDDARIDHAVESLTNMLETQSLAGKTFIDVGSGSGLFSLAARKLGATVHSFDYDPQSVQCTEMLRNQHFPEDSQWYVEQGSALDEAYLQSIGTFDVVYSWGVLHHTGSMWKALDNVAPLVKENGQLFIAIYNDQGTASHRWLKVKQLYNRASPRLQFLIVVAVGIFFESRTALSQLIKLKNPIAHWKSRRQKRGMAFWTNLVDWVGGYPFEFAKPEAIFDFYRKRGFRLTRLYTCRGGHGCNQFVFHKESSSHAVAETASASETP